MDFHQAVVELHENIEEIKRQLKLKRLRKYLKLILIGFLIGRDSDKRIFELTANSSHNLISRNRVSDNEFGITLVSSSNENLIFRNDITNNTNGIRLSGGSSNKVSGNIIAANHVGIGLVACSGNYITRNDVANNTVGIQLTKSVQGGSLDNYISENSIENNQYGISLLYYESYNNMFYHNNFVDNVDQILLGHNSSFNIWDNGYPSGGNYWSDYEERYPNAEEIDESGIWNTPYVIDENNTDYYPLMKPWPWVSASVNINPDTLNLKSRGRWITAYIELPKGYDVKDINVSSIALNNTILAEMRPTGFGDEDGDGITNLMVKFDRGDLIEYMLSSMDKTEKFITITLTITGKLNDGTMFEGSNTITVMPKNGIRAGYKFTK